MADKLLIDAEAEARGFVRPVTVASLEESLRRSTDVTRYRVVSRRLFRFPRARSPGKAWLSPTEEGFERWLGRLLALVPAEVPIPDFDFAANLGDYPVRGLPVLTWWSGRGLGNARMPCGVHWQDDRSVPLHDPSVRGDRRFDPVSLERPWDERENRVVWRGSATGMYDRTFRAHRLGGLVDRLRGRPLGHGVPRLDLVRISETHPDVVDARIVAWPQVGGGLRERLVTRYGTHPSVPRTWFLRSRWVVNVDGNTATSSFLTFVGSGSVVLKQESPYLDWCGHHLRPGEHYMGVARDLHDLVPVARRALAEPERGAAIARAGRSFAERFLTGAAIDVYMLALLDRYAAIAPRPNGAGPDAIAVS